MNAIKNWISLKNVISLIGLIISIIWLYLSTKAHGCFAPYAVMFALGCITSIAIIYKSGENKWLNKEIDQPKQHTVLVCVFSSVFSLCVTLANYNLWSGASHGLIKLIILLIGGFFIWYSISVFTINNKSLLTIKPKEHKYKPIFAFIVPFCAFVILNLIVLFTALFPGNVTPDSLFEIGQAIDGINSNHNPYFHELLIQFALFLGQTFFGSYQAGVAVYSVISILFMSTCFSLALYTLYQVKIPNVFVIISFLFLLLMPYHISYMVTMWKDIIFGGFALLFCLYLFRTIKCVGNQKVNYVMMVVSSLGAILFRSNAFLAFILFLIAAIILLRKSNKKLIILLCVCCGLGLFLRFPAMAMLNVKQPNLGESLSIPAQQIGATYIVHNDFTDEQNEFLSKVMDTDKITTTYIPGNADPMKDRLRDKNPEYLKEHLGEFMSIYFSGLIKHPSTYIKTWIDQTKGFWNGGYNQCVFIVDMVVNNDFGIYKACKGTPANMFMNDYNNFILQEPFCLFRSIGFFTWIFMYLLFVSIVRKNKAAFLGVFFNLAVILTLLIATPEFAEFRYAYCLFCCVPFLAWVTFLPHPNSR